MFVLFKCEVSGKFSKEPSLLVKLLEEKGIKPGVPELLED